MFLKRFHRLIYALGINLRVLRKKVFNTCFLGESGQVGWKTEQGKEMTQFLQPNWDNGYPSSNMNYHRIVRLGRDNLIKDGSGSNTVRNFICDLTEKPTGLL